MEKTPSLFGIILRLLVVISIALYIFLKFSFDIFDIHFDKRNLKYSLLFEHATGVQTNTQIEVSGFKIGHVTGVKHIKDNGTTKAKVEVVVNQEYQDIITDKAYFFIAKRKFIGLTFIQMIPVLEGKILDPGATINGISPPRYNLLFDRAKELLIYFNKFLEKSHFNDLLEEYKSLIAETKLLKKIVNEKIPSLKSNSLKLIEDVKKLKKVYENHQESLVKDGENIFFITNNLLDNSKDRIIKTLDNTEELSEKIIDLKDDSLYLIKKERKEIDKIIENVEKSIITINKIQKNVEKTMDIIDVGIGNVGLLLNDKEIYDYSRFIFKIIKQESYRYFLPIKHKVK
jgi:hypothetical protein